MHRGSLSRHESKVPYAFIEIRIIWRWYNKVMFSGLF